MKRFLIFSIVFILFFGQESLTFAQPFKDVPKNNRFYEDVEYLKQKKVLPFNEYFELNRSATRGEVASILVDALQLKTPTHYIELQDVPTNSPITSKIQAAIHHGLLQGFPDGTFRPNDPINRGQMALILNRSFSYEKKRDDFYGFSDIPQGTELAEAVNKLDFVGIVAGTNDYKYSPYLKITRGQMAAMIARALRYEEEPYIQGYTSLYLAGYQDDQLSPGEYLIKPRRSTTFHFFIAIDGNISKEHTIAGFSGEAAQDYLYLHEGLGIGFEGQLIALKDHKPEKKSFVKAPGTYKVGYDLEPGMYLAAPYFFHKDGKIASLNIYGDPNKIRLIANRDEQHHPYEIYLHAGQYVKIAGVELYKISE